MLNSDQQRALTFIKQWWFSDHQCMILDGKGGTGKSFLIEEVIRTLPEISPLIICPTHEALKQIKDKVHLKADLFKTAHSALGLAPTVDEKELKFEQFKAPKIWNEINFVVADECSMYNEVIMELLIKQGCKILFVGHHSQLPPVKKQRKISDPCISPVFTKGFPQVTLTIPQRNTGKLWDFNNLLEEQIYQEGNVIVPSDYDISRKELSYYIMEHGKDEIFTGETKFVSWSNVGVDTLNARLRKSIFGEKSTIKKYLPGDKVILTKPYTSIMGLEVYNYKRLIELSPEARNLNTFFSNSKAEIISCEDKVVRLDNILSIPVYKLTVMCEGSKAEFFEPMFSEDHKRIADYYERKAWDAGSTQTKKKLYRERAFIMSCFAEIKHYYAATAHRLQGASIPNIVVMLSDISRNPNPIERRKCIYVATSRTINNLRIYRNIT